MCGLPPKTIVDYEYGSYKGYFAENFVLQEFLFAGINSLFCWQEQKSEVEFLIEKNGDVIPIEVKAGNITQTKSLIVFANKYKPKYSIVFSARPFRYESRKETYYLPLYLAGQILGRFPAKP